VSYSPGLTVCFIIPLFICVTALQEYVNELSSQLVSSPFSPLSLSPTCMPYTIYYGTCHICYHEHFFLAQPVFQLILSKLLVSSQLVARPFSPLSLSSTCMLYPIYYGTHYICYHEHFYLAHLFFNLYSPNFSSFSPLSLSPPMHTVSHLLHSLPMLL
jgi:hypothetical protein